METPLNGYLESVTVQRVAGILLSGEIAVFPTDTIYGFHCLASRDSAVAEILSRKGRIGGGGLIVIASDLAMADIIIAEWPGESRALLARVWPAALTAVLPASPAVSPVIAPRGAVALRVPACDDLRAVVRAVGEPIVSTSVNITGREPMSRIGEIRKAFPGLGAYIARHGRSGVLPSTVVDFTPGSPRLVREGRYRWTKFPRMDEGKS